MKPESPSLIYLDHNATCPPAPEVRDMVRQCMEECFGNASSPHVFGRAAKARLVEARDHVAALIGARPDEIVFTTGGSMADNLAIQGTARKGGRRSGHLVTTAVEHPAVIEPCRALERAGFDVTVVPVDGEGRVDAGAVADAIRDDTVLVSVMAANNETGTVMPVADIGAVCREKGVPFHVDAVQAVGKMVVDVNAWHADLLACSAHKIHGPKGIGALWVRDGFEPDPILFGGKHERGFNPGTLNIPAIAGFGKAAWLLQQCLEEDVDEITRLRDLLEAELRWSLDGVHLNGSREHRLCNTLNLRFDWIEGEAIMLMLDAAGVAVSTGSACAAGTGAPSPILQAMGIPPRDATGSVRFSLGRNNTEAEIREAAARIKPVIGKLRAMSPLTPD